MSEENGNGEVEVKPEYEKLSDARIPARPGLGRSVPQAFPVQAGQMPGRGEQRAHRMTTLTPEDLARAKTQEFEQSLNESRRAHRADLIGIGQALAMNVSGFDALPLEEVARRVQITAANALGEIERLKAKKKKNE